VCGWRLGFLRGARRAGKIEGSSESFVKTDHGELFGESFDHRDNRSPAQIDHNQSTNHPEMHTLTLVILMMTSTVVCQAG
jgi:hypothetical protein